MAKQDPPADLFFNRELSWLEFNDRVLREGLNEALPLFERLKFLAIVSSNLDEFFMIRVAGLMQQRAAGIRKRDPSGMTPSQQLKAISQRTHRMVEEQASGIRKSFDKLREERIHLLEPADWDASARSFLQSYFDAELLPVLTPLAIEDLDPSPLLPGLQLFIGLVLDTHRRDAEPDPTDDPESSSTNPKIAVVPVPSRLARFITIPTDEDGLHLVPLEHAIAEHVGTLFPGCDVLASAVFRITRDADVAMLDADAGDLLNAVEQAVLARRRRSVVRLSISAEADRRLKHWLMDWLDVRSDDVYEIDGLLDATALWGISGRSGHESLKSPDWPPQPPADLTDVDDLWQAIQERDRMLFHPYESFDPVVELLRQAAEDPKVLAIKQTLYRTSGDSPIVRALERAAKNGKEVTALVELKARFDEAQNVVWARRLEDAGCHVIYGIAGYKTHAKALLIVRREVPRIRRYVHLSTGNYNDKTAKVYSDIGMMTANPDIARDVAALFNLLTGYSEAVGWSKLTVEPRALKERFIELIDREIRTSTPEEPGLIMAKINSLQDRDITVALSRASQAGVKVRLNIRGICCLRPGVEGLTENIEVCSVIDRFLEHARIFYFRNGGHEEVYMSSADWMRRNLEQRVEILFPVSDASLRRRLIKILNILFSDNVKSRRLLPDGTYEPITKRGKPIRAQEKFYRQALESTAQADQKTIRFQPLTRPKE